MVENELDKIKIDIENYDELKPYKLDIEIIENQSGQIMKLIKDVEGFSYQLKNQYYSFKFTEAIYIQEVVFKTEEDTNLKGLEIIAYDYKGNNSISNFISRIQQQSRK